ncbi:malonate decarboxylase subunit alpha [Roseicitreum antarcticum]|uniref:Acetate CoA-transferase YdiF n=1 Tax=Roseicitreum antarcticum TaxID=564137 RepID=A0A1H2YJV0_9RHOB|nr:malonate decarboxylase subunit alpha [Roseicitreum antarcticum]SDX05436.1 propionate CoA-transferase [Roseicitreum antarcticum]
MRIISVKEAADVVPNGATVAVSGGGYRVTPEALTEALSERFVQTGAPRNLTVVAIAMVERGRGGKGGAASGLNLLARKGMMSRVITSSFSRASSNELNMMISSNAAAAYNLPMGTLIQLLRATAAGRAGFATPVGIGTFVDPRQGGGKMNTAAHEDFCRITSLEGEEMIYYPRLPIDVALIKASAADERGNLFFDREAFDHGTIELAMAAFQSGGKVIAEVNRIVKVGEIHPRMGRIPARIVDAIVVQPDAWEDEQDPVLTGAERRVLTPPSGRNLPRDFIARLAVNRLPTEAMINLGAGLPMYEVPEQARSANRDDLYFTVEQGPMGGWPQVGGVSRNPELILDQNEVFQFYEGGGPDVSILSFGEVDAKGNINVSRFSGMMPGCGGFVNIVHGVRDLIFCGTLTTGSLNETLTPDGLVIAQEGRIRRFVKDVEQITFNAQMGLSSGKRVTIVTDRGIFAVTPQGLVLREIVPGVDVQRDIIDQIPFDITVASDVSTVSAALLMPAPQEVAQPDKTKRA